MFFAYIWEAALLSEGAEAQRAETPRYTVSRPSQDDSGANPMYYRRRFSSFEEFQRESFDYGDREYGKDELELVEELEAVDEHLYKPRRAAGWD